MARLDALLEGFSNYHGGDMKWRLEKELKYARRVSFVHGGKYDGLLSDAFAKAQVLHDRDGALTCGSVLEIESMLSPMSGDCKKYRLLMVGHAHIDMNWMWRYDETVSITLDTFRTMLNLMNDFPAFTFAQSQASTYAIVEEHEPEMIEEIKARIKSGQWEVSASTWVEADRNMPNAESVARHFLYTKRYLPKLLGIDAGVLNFDFEPDTFGHHQNVPEMLCQAGVKYYYHCRGEQGQTLYRWASPSGKQILCYLEPTWYLGPITGDEAERVPEFCDRFGIDAALTVYGVGDHGGGPTRRDLERIQDMGTWPIYPRVEFGTYAKFYECAESARNVPILTGERNVVFTGCYTTQTRIKQGNRMAERMLYDGEALNAFAALNTGAPYRRDAFEQGWRRVLFNQFHDIIPGSGVIDTREHAMGNYQQAFSVANSAIRCAVNTIAQRIDTSGFLTTDQAGTTGEGAGQGFGVYDFKLGQVSRGGGKNRVFHVFNPLSTARKEVAEFILWDYTDSLERIEFVDSHGEAVRHQVLDSKFNHYWQHEWARVMVEVEVPATGYATYGLRLKGEAEMKPPHRGDPRVEKPFKMLLENELVKVEFDEHTGDIAQMEDLEAAPFEAEIEGGFRLITEDGTAGMTSWTVGRQRDFALVGHGGVIKKLHGGPLYQAYSVSAPVGERSKLEYIVSLRAGEPFVEYDVRCDWQEYGSEALGIPQLQFAIMPPDWRRGVVYNVPGGLIHRHEEALDVPSQGMALAGGGMLMCDSKYGFRYHQNRLSVTLIRSSFDPDPYPELGKHHFKLAVGQCRLEGAALLDEVERWNHPLHVISGTEHGGDLPLERSFMSVEGSAVVSGVKLCEDEDALLVRLCDVDGQGETTLLFDREVASACLVDTLECPVNLPVHIEGRSVHVPLDAQAMGAVKVRFGHPEG